MTNVKMSEEYSTTGNATIGNRARPEEKIMLSSKLREDAPKIISVCLEPAAVDSF
jgi:hypothetical protein